jgi:hypothetical protein
MGSDDFIYRGNLAETPMPEMLATIHRYRVPGVMELTAQDMTKTVHILDGDIIFATSSDRKESFGDFLLQKGRITEAQYRVSVDEMDRSPNRRHGSILVDMGFLEPGELGPLVREQVQLILWTLFDWQAGEVSFRVGRFREHERYKIKIPTPRAILAGCRHISDPRRLTTKMGGRQAVLKRARVPEHLRGLRLESSEHDLLELVDGATQLQDLCEQGPYAPGENARVLYAFAVLGIVETATAGSSAIKIHVPQKNAPV